MAALGLVGTVAILRTADPVEAVTAAAAPGSARTVRILQRGDPDVVLVAPPGELPGREEVGDAVDPADPGVPSSAFGGLILPDGFVPTGVPFVVARPVDSAEFDDRRLGELSSDGRTWRIDDLRPGRWVVSARVEAAHRRATGVTEPFAVGVSPERGPIDIVLLEYVIEGRVVDSEGVPARGTSVGSASMLRFSDDGGGRLNSSVGDFTDADGRYRIALYGPAEFELVAGETAARTYVIQKRVVRLDADERRVTADFVLERTARVSGRISRVDGGGLSEVAVEIRALETGRAQAVELDDRGAFAVTGLVPGAFALYARVRLGRGRYLTAYERFDLEPGEAAFLADQLDYSGEAAGRVLRANGSAVADTQVRLRGDDDRDVSHFASTDASGRFELVGLYDRAYEVEVTGYALSGGPRRVVVPSRAGTVGLGDVVVEER